MLPFYSYFLLLNSLQGPEKKALIAYKTFLNSISQKSESLSESVLGYIWCSTRIITTELPSEPEKLVNFMGKMQNLKNMQKKSLRNYLVNTVP